MTTGERTPTVSDKTLRRLLIFGSIAVIVLVVAFSTIYYFGQHVDAGPSLTDRAVTHAESAVKSQPSNIGLRLTLAQAYQADNRNDDALTQYNEVLKAVPNNATSLIGRAGLYMAQANYPLAQKDYQTVVSMANNAEFAGANTQIQAAHYWLAVILFKQHNVAAAAGQAKAALAMDPTDSDSWYLVGQVALKQGAPKSAVSSFVRALTFVPSGWCQPYQGLVTAYGELKDVPHTTYYQASLALCQNKPDAAAALFKQITSGPVAASADLELGNISEAKGDKAAALTWYRKVLTIAPHDSNAKAAIARLTKAGAVAAGAN